MVGARNPGSSSCAEAPMLSHRNQPPKQTGTRAARTRTRVPPRRPDSGGKLPFDTTAMVAVRGSAGRGDGDTPQDTQRTGHRNLGERAGVQRAAVDPVRRLAAVG